MGKKSVSWPDFLKIKFEEMKKSKPALQFKELLQDPTVKTEWKKITDGTHPMYEKGAMTRKAKKVKTPTTSDSKSPSVSSSDKMHSDKMHSDEMHSYEKVSAQDVLDNCNLCKTCTKKVHKYLHRVIGGDSSPATVAESNQGSLVQQAKATIEMQHAGGDKRKSKKKRGGCVGPCGVYGGGGKKRKSMKRKLNVK